MMPRTPSSAVSGISMIEVLVTIIILAFGLLGLAGFQMRAQTAEMESYQRAQALVLMSDMVERITANRSIAATYPSNTVWGTDDATYASCAALAVGSAARDHCEWSEALKGSAELSGAAKIGAMVGARGCITLIQASDAAAGVCTPGIYEVAVAWQGMAATAAPANTCAQNLFGADTNRRVVTTRITVGLPGCT